MQSLRRGSITKNFNEGLRNPQAKQLEISTYNSGCDNPWGCVSNTGYKCQGGHDNSEGINKMYEYLNAPLLEGVYREKSEYDPPAYAQGIKAGTVNSVSGWTLKQSGKWDWQRTG